MSTYGTALVIDAPDQARLGEIGTRLASEAAEVFRSTAPDGWTRLTASWDGIEHVGEVRRFLEELGTARAAVAEDHDEFGAHWTVLSAVDGEVQSVHCRYLLNADPDDPKEVAALIRAHGRDPRIGDDAGENAAAAAAALFGVDPSGVVEAERESTSAHLMMGTIGGPFPWWEPLGLSWPGDGAGVPVEPAFEPTKLLRINRATWPRFARQRLVPLLPEPEQWEVAAFGLVRRPTRWLARGIAYSGSSGDWFYAYAFVIPLYLPTEHVYFNYALALNDSRGHRSFDLPRQNSQDRLGADMARAVQEHAIGHLDAVGTLEGFADLLASNQAEALAEGRTGAGGAEKLGYALALLGRIPEALDQLRIASVLDKDAPDWQKEEARRATVVADMLERSPRVVTAQLDKWADQSAQTLGINRQSPLAPG